MSLVVPPCGKPAALGGRGERLAQGVCRETLRPHNAQSVKLNHSNMRELTGCLADEDLSRNDLYDRGDR